VPVPVIVLPEIDPDPVPTVEEVKEKVASLPEIVPEAVPASVVRPKLVKPMVPVPLKAVPLWVIVAFRLPVTSYLVSVHVPAHVPTRACDDPPPVVVVTEEVEVVVLVVVLQPTINRLNNKTHATIIPDFIIFLLRRD